jgi:uncharacterized RDD family membrane protein YckC
MVFPDHGAPPRATQKATESSTTTMLASLSLARPLDRLAATVVDIFVVLVPFYILLSAPLKRSMTTSFLLNSDSDFFIYSVLMFFVAFSLIVVYQSVLHFLYGATIGKRLFNLRVRSVFSEQELHLADHFFRSFVWALELVCFGIPFLAVFGNGQRRPWHDRLADSVVVSTSGGVPAPTLWEKSLVRGLFGASLVMVFLFGALQVRGLVQKMQIEQTILSMSEHTEGECEVVTQSLGHEAEGQHERLNMAMTLYASGLADRSCLEAEVEREVANQIPVDAVTYLAQAFVHAEDAEISNSYLTKICEEAPSAVECAMSRLITAWSDQRWEDVDAILRDAHKGSGYLEIWGVRHHMKQAQYPQALELLSGLVKRRELSEFVLVQRVKALANSFHEAEANAAFEQAWMSLPEDQAQSLSIWMCSQQLQNSCSAAQSPACRLRAPQEEFAVSDSHAALADLLALECQGESAVDYAELIDSVNDLAWKTFLRAALKSQMQDRATAANLLSSLLEYPATPDILKIEAVRRLSMFASSRQIEGAVEAWTSFESKEAWVKAGNFLFNQLVEQRNSDMAIEVARHLMQVRSLSPRGMTLLSSMMEKGPANRQPASQKDPVLNLLRQLEDGK